LIVNLFIECKLIIYFLYLFFFLIFVHFNRSRSICCLLDIDDQVKENGKPSFIPFWVHDRLTVISDTSTIGGYVSTIELIKDVLNGIIDQVVVNTELKEEVILVDEDSTSEIIVNNEERKIASKVVNILRDVVMDEDNNDKDVKVKEKKHNAINGNTIISSNSSNNSSSKNNTPPFISRVNSLQVLRPLFDKKRSQIVAIWCVEVSSSGFDQIIQRTLKFDHLRKKYLKFYLELCILNNQLSYISDVISYILGM
jgi:hypothetical protein